MLISLRNRLATVNINSWHYRLTRYGTGDLGDRLKRACPYWTILIPVSTVTGLIRLLVTAVYYTIGHVAFYPWILLGWLFGYKPTHWRGLYKVYSSESTVFRRRSRYYYAHSWKMPVLIIGPAVGLVAGLVFGVGLDEDAVKTAFSIGPIYLPFAIYGEVLLLIALGNFLGPLVMKAYCAVCPEIKYVETVPETSKPSLPPAQAKT